MSQFGKIFKYKDIVEMMEDDDLGPYIAFSDVEFLKTIVDDENNTIKKGTKYDGCTFYVKGVSLYFYDDNKKDIYISKL